MEGERKLRRIRKGEAGRNSEVWVEEREREGGRRKGREATGIRWNREITKEKDEICWVGGEKKVKNME